MPAKLRRVVCAVFVSSRSSSSDRNVESALVIRVIYGFIDSSYSRDKQHNDDDVRKSCAVDERAHSSSGEWSEKPFTHEE